MSMMREDLCDAIKLVYSFEKRWRIIFEEVDLSVSSTTANSREALNSKVTNKTKVIS